MEAVRPRPCPYGPRLAWLVGPTGRARAPRAASQTYLWLSGPCPIQKQLWCIQTTEGPVVVGFDRPARRRKLLEHSVERLATQDAGGPRRDSAPSANAPRTCSTPCECRFASLRASPMLLLRGCQPTSAIFASLSQSHGCLHLCPYLHGRMRERIPSLGLRS